MIDNTPVVLSSEEKNLMCEELANHLPQIRKLLHLSQAGMGERVGVSRNRIILIETGKFVMTWSQYTSLLFLFVLNQQAKEYLFINNLLSPKLFQFMQQKGPLSPPDINAKIDNSMAWSYGELVQDYLEKINQVEG